MLDRIIFVYAALIYVEEALNKEHTVEARTYLLNLLIFLTWG